MGQFRQPRSASEPARRPSTPAPAAHGSCWSTRCATPCGPASWPPGPCCRRRASLAADLGLARNTVAEAYADLVAEGWLASRQGAGTWVVNTRDIRSPQPAARHPRPADAQPDARLPGRRGLPPRRLAGLGAPRLDRRTQRRAAARGDPRGRPELRDGAGRIPRPRPRGAHLARHHRHLRGHPQRRRAAGAGVRRARADRGGGLRAVHLSRGDRRDGGAHHADRLRPARRRASTNSTGVDAAAALLDARPLLSARRAAAPGRGGPR